MNGKTQIFCINASVCTQAYSLCADVKEHRTKMRIRPSEIFFSQDSINNVFDKNCSHSYQPIGQTLDALCEGRCSVRNIPTISVSKRDCKWYTADNRRLWVFRQLERLGKCGEIDVWETSYISSSKFTTYNAGTSVDVRGSPGGSWHRKPSVMKPNLPVLADHVSISLTDGDKENIDANRKYSAARDSSIERPPFQTLDSFVSVNKIQQELVSVNIEMNGLAHKRDAISISSYTEEIETENKGYSSSSDSIHSPIPGGVEMSDNTDSKIDILDDGSVRVDINPCDKTCDNDNNNIVTLNGHKNGKVDNTKKKMNLCCKLLSLFRCLFWQ